MIEPLSLLFFLLIIAKLLISIYLNLGQFSRMNLLSKVYVLSPVNAWVKH